MPYYHYTIKSHKIAGFTGATAQIPADFNHYETNFTAGHIYYKADKSGINEIIRDHELSEAKSTAEVEEFLKNLHPD